jgi:hypothetical protein
MERSATVHRERRTGDERGLSASQEQQRVRDSQRVGDPLQRIGADVALAPRRHRRVHHARTDAIDPDRGREFGGQERGSD